MARGHFLANDQIYDRLWPKTDPAAAQTNLRAVVSDLRKILEPDLKQGRNSSFILTQHEGYTLQLGPQVWLDLAEFERLAASSTLSDQEAALALYRGDLLEEDPYADWAIPERDRAKAIYLNLLAQSAQHLFAESAYAQCIERCEQALAVAPTDESVWRILMQAQAASGNRAAALTTFERCRASLSRELGVDPAPETAALHESLLHDSPALPTATQIETGLTPPAALPRWLSLVGASGFALWASLTGLSFGLSVAGLVAGTAISPGDPGIFALPYLASYPAALADLNQHLYLFFPTGWLLFVGYLAWFQGVRAKRPTLAWLGFCAGLADAVTQTLGQAIGLVQLVVLPTAYLTASASQQVTLITVWDLLRQFAALAGTIGLIANPLALLLLLWASRTEPQFSKTLVYLGLAMVLASVAYDWLPAGAVALLAGITLVFGLRLWLLGWALNLWMAGEDRIKSTTPPLQP